jgi:hypothetical protein
MKTAAALVVTGFVLLATVASADPQPTPATRGTVTAYEADGKTVIAVRGCSAGRHGGTDYMTCGSALRTEIKTLMCARGKGTHTWQYQIGDGPHLPQVAFCR